MKLLIDENISHRILKLIDKHFPHSIHVSSVRKSRFSDLDIWLFAKENDYIVLTYDADFYEWQLIRGYPPKIIWLRFGNSKTEIIADKLINNIGQIQKFIKNNDVGLLEVHQ
jgi:predicted nuclease of predicted toxin-antitoxin system